MEIRRVHKSKINPAPYNPRKDLQPEDVEYQKLARSIEAFGDVEPLVWNERTGNLVGGHQRLKILLDQGREEFDVSVVNLDDTAEKQLNLALNKISGEWDNDKLSQLLSELADVADIALTGFDTSELERICGEWQSDGVSFIDDLLAENFVEMKNDSKDYFQVSLTFPVEHKQQIDDYININGKGALVALILDCTGGDQDA